MTLKEKLEEAFYSGEKIMVNGKECYVTGMNVDASVHEQQLTFRFRLSDGRRRIFYEP